MDKSDIENNSINLFNSYKEQLPNNVFTDGNSEFILYKGIKIQLSIHNKRIEIYSTGTDSYHKFPQKYNFILSKYGIKKGILFFNLFRSSLMILELEKEINNINKGSECPSINYKEVEKLLCINSIKEFCNFIKNKHNGSIKEIV